MNEYNFLDYSREWLFKDMYAIELEVSTNYINENFRWWTIHSESTHIKEFIQLHDRSVDDIKKVIDHTTDFYKERFPVGSSWQLSWGVHFHLFNWDFKWMDRGMLSLKLLNCPLFWKIKRQKIYIRYMWSWSIFRTDWVIATDSKSDAVTYKRNSHSDHWKRFSKPSIEFRCNNVIDTRMYWYYVWIVLAVKGDVKFKKTSDRLREYCKKWNPLDYRGDHEMELKDIVWHRIDEEDWIVMNFNIMKILNLLEKHWLIEAGLALQEYLNERGFDIHKTFSQIDSHTWESITDFISMSTISLFRVEHKWLKFKDKENFFLYIEGIIKKKLLNASIAWVLVTIKRNEIVKKYWVLLTTNSNYREQINMSVETQTTLIN